MINCGVVRRQRPKGFELGVGNCEKVTKKYTGETNGRQRLLSRVVCTDASWYQLPVSGDKSVLFFLVQGEHIFPGKFMSCF